MNAKTQRRQDDMEIGILAALHLVYLPCLDEFPTINAQRLTRMTHCVILVSQSMTVGQ